jgi:hypothetical protein
MDRDFLLILDEWRRRSGVAIRIIDDARTLEEHRRLYQREILAGRRLPNSAHLRGRAVDCRPVVAGEAAELELVHAATQMWKEGRWPYLGLEIASRHLHVDNDPELAESGVRPMLWAGVSK